MHRLDSLSWTLVLILCVTLGLAPYVPEPHVWEKLKMLGAGALGKPIDIFDFVLHGAPWLLLGLKAFRNLSQLSVKNGG